MFVRPATHITMSQAARILSQRSYNRRRNKIIDRANELALIQNKPLIPRRPE